MAGKGKHKRTIEFHVGGSVCMESGLVDIYPPNYLLEDAKLRSDFMPDPSIAVSEYPTCISGLKVKKKLQSSNPSPSKSSIGDTESSIDNAIKKMAMERFHGRRFTGRAADLVTARYGIHPKKIQDDYSFDVNAEYTQPFDINIQVNIATDGSSTPYCAGIALHGHSLNPNSSFIFISQAYRIFLGDITNDNITLRLCNLTSAGKKMQKALREGVTLKDGLTEKKLLSFIYTQIDSLDEPHTVYDFSSANVSQYGTPITYGWHASFQVNSRQQQNFAVVLHKATTQGSEILDTCFVQVQLNHTETINPDDGTYSDAWSGTITIDLGDKFKPYRTDYIWLPNPPYEMQKQIYFNTSVEYGNGFVYTFFSQNSDLPCIVRYAATPNQYSREFYEFEGEWCGLPSAEKSGYVDKFLADKGFYIEQGGIRIVDAISQQGAHVEVSTEYLNISVDSTYDGFDAALNVCDGDFEIKYRSQSWDLWNYADDGNGTFLTVRQNYSGDAISARISQSHTGSSHLVVQGNDAVFCVQSSSYTESANKNSGHGLSGHTIAVKEFTTYYDDQGNLITEQVNQVAIKVKTTLSIPSWQPLESYSNQPFHNITVYMMSPVIEGAKVVDNVGLNNINNPVWQNVVGAELTDLTINPLIQCFEGNALSLYHGLDGLESNHYAQVTAYFRPVGWV